MVLLCVSVGKVSMPTARLGRGRNTGTCDEPGAAQLLRGMSELLRWNRPRSQRMNRV